MARQIYTKSAQVNAQQHELGHSSTISKTKYSIVLSVIEQLVRRSMKEIALCHGYGSLFSVIMIQLMMLKLMNVWNFICCFTVTNSMIGLRIEWMKSRARAERWSEEVVLTEEEMRRVLDFLDWKSNWWIGQGHLQQNKSPELREGCAAYAAKQAKTLQDMAASFAQQWWPILEGHGMHTMEWPAGYRQSSEIIADVEIQDKVDEYEVDDLLFWRFEWK
jgi:hypothetical protein